MIKHVWLVCGLLALLFPPIGAAQELPPLKVGINLAGVADWSTEYPFVDVFKMARPWISQREGAEWGQGGALALTPEGWVAALEDGQYAETLMFSADPAFNIGLDGNYTLLYDGEGSLTFSGNNARILDASAGRMIVEARPSEGAIFLQLRATNPNDPLRNIRFLMPNTEAIYQTQPFNTVFLERIERFGVLRFMDWMNTNNSTIATWDERPQVSDATYAWRGVPVEIMVQLANILHTDMWVNMPHMADDDYVRQFAMLVRENLAPELNVYIEYSNETWNGQFQQAGYVVEQGTALNLAGDDAFWSGLKFHAHRAVEIFTIWEDMFGGTDRLVRVVASQAANAWTGEQVALEAGTHADALAIAPYFSCDDATNSGNIDSLDQLLDQQMANVLVGGCAYQYMVDNLAVAEELGLYLIAYEGGQHLVSSNTQLADLFTTANRDPRMGDVYLAYLHVWCELGGGTFMIFSDVAQPSIYGNWGLLESITQPPYTAPKYQAVMTFLDELSE